MTTPTPHGPKAPHGGAPKPAKRKPRQKRCGRCGSVRRGKYPTGQDLLEMHRAVVGLRVALEQRGVISGECPGYDAQATRPHRVDHGKLRHAEALKLLVADLSRCLGVRLPRYGSSGVGGEAGS